MRSKAFTYIVIIFTEHFSYSGGPFICKHEISGGEREAILYGLTSYGQYGCGKEGLPDFFSDVK